MLCLQSLLFVTWSWAPMAENKIKGNICVKCFRLNLIINFFLQLCFKTKKKKTISIWSHLYMQLPRWQWVVGKRACFQWKEAARQCRRCKRHGFDPWVGKITWRRTWPPTPVFLPGKSKQRSLVGYSPWGRKVGHDWSDLACMHTSYGRARIRNGLSLQISMVLLCAVWWN